MPLSPGCEAKKPPAEAALVVERDTDLAVLSPNDVARSGGAVRDYRQREAVGKPKWALGLDTSARNGDVANDTIDDR